MNWITEEMGLKVLEVTLTDMEKIAEQDKIEDSNIARKVYFAYEMEVC